MAEWFSDPDNRIATGGGGRRPVYRASPITALPKRPAAGAEPGDPRLPRDSSDLPSGKAGGVRDGRSRHCAGTSARPVSRVRIASGERAGSYNADTGR